MNNVQPRRTAPRTSALIHNDQLDDSRPILVRLGLHPVADTRPYVLAASNEGPAGSSDAALPLGTDVPV